ncbi:LptE family protein [Candidatus Zixiibacteriota bacterium]
MSYMKKSLLLSLLGGLVLFGCGVYSFSGSGLPSHIRTVAVPVFDNQTAEYGIKENLSDQVIDALVTDGKLKVVQERDADSVVEGTVVEYQNRAYTFDNSENVQEYIVRIWVRVAYQDVRNRKAIWEEERMEGWGTYDVSIDPPEDEELGRERAIAKLAEDIVDKVVAGW